VETLLGGWRALSRLEVDGFALLRSRGVTRRGHSVVPLAPPVDPAALSAALDRIEGLCAAAGESPTYRLFVGEGIDHEPVRAALTGRGFVEGERVHLLHRPLDAARPAPDPRAEVAVGAPTAPWLDASWRLAPRPEEGARETLRELMAGTPAIYLALAESTGPTPTGRALAVGRAALVPHRRRTVAVLDQIAVDPERRRQGLGRACVDSLLALAAVQGADLAVLEVEDSNTAARSLYRGAGFRPVGEYRYLAPAPSTA
jgi:GNAT superfamily N-acetyltransferase